MTVEKTVKYIWFTLITAMLVGILCSWRLWTNDRFFPITPVLSCFENTPHILSYFLLVVMCITLVIQFFSNKKIIGNIFIVTALLIALMDQNRWQPWFYEYFAAVTFIIFSFNNTKVKYETIANGIALIFCGVYIWSGIQKINTYYINESSVWLVEPLSKYFNNNIVSFFQFIVKQAWLFELFIGIGLLIKVTRKIAMTMAFAMHIFILLLMGPLGKNYNMVIIPWNIATLLIIWLLFVKSNYKPTFTYIIHDLKKRMSVKIIYTLFGIMPLLSLANYWDAYLSASLYSGNTSNGYIYMTEKSKTKLPFEIQQQCVRQDTMYYIYIDNWSMSELNVPSIPEKRLYINVKNKLVELTHEPNEIYLYIEGKAPLFGEKTKEMVE